MFCVLSEMLGHSGENKILYLERRNIYIIEILRKWRHFQLFILVIDLTKTFFFFKIWRDYNLKFYKNTYKNVAERLC